MRRRAYCVRGPANPARNTAALIDQLQLLRQRGLEVILVTSGAIPLGMSILGKRVRPKELAKVQGLSAVGQCALMHPFSRRTLLPTLPTMRFTPARY